MELLKVGELYLPNCYPSEVNSKGILEYFIYGQGWKKTKNYKIVEGVELPDRWADISWLDIAILYDKYGIEVANQYAEKKTAGIVSRQTARGKGILYAAIKNILPENFNPLFFDCLCVDYMLSCFGFFVFDILATDKKLAAIDKKYNSEGCEYDGKKNVSMSQYIAIAYGSEYVQIIDLLIKSIELPAETIE